MLSSHKNSMFWISAVLLQLLSFQVLGQSEVKRSRSPASEVKQCIPDDPIYEMRLRPAQTRRDASCFVDIAQAKDIMKHPSAVPIDIRTTEEFVHSHLNSAINLQPAQIKTKRYLADKSLLVYGSGKSSPMLEELCAELKEHGFRNAKILTGGISAWAISVDALREGVDIRRIAALSAEDLYAEFRVTDNVLIALSEKFRHSDAGKRLIHIALPLTPENLAGAVRKAASPSDKTRIRRVVLVGVSGVDSKLLDQMLASSKLGLPVFFYPGDTDEYDTARKAMQAMWAKREKGPAPHRCGAT